jgi:hypothetical protein
VTVFFSCGGELNEKEVRVEGEREREAGKKT